MDAMTLLQWLLGIVGALITGFGVLGSFWMRLTWRLMGNAEKVNATSANIASIVASLKDSVEEHADRQERRADEYEKQRDRAVDHLGSKIDASTETIVTEIRRRPA